jgi:hypothetical protein
MEALLASEMLDIWEKGQAMSPVQRSLLILAKAMPEISSGELASMSIGQRDACLMNLRNATFGRRVSCLEPCPGCGDLLELDLRAEDIMAEDPDLEAPGLFSINVEDYEVRFRLPNSLDLLSVSRCGNAAAARKIIVKRCILEESLGGRSLPGPDLPDEVLDAISRCMGEADRAADVEMELRCPACSHQWLRIFDIVSFFWTEISALAYRTLRDVHDLALFFGWSERDILAMSPRRRQMYLEMVHK